MDPKTIAVYDANSDQFIADWMTQTPAMIRALVLKHFSPPAAVIDVGSGSGRDVAWLMEQGFQAEGVDASEGLIAAATSKFPHGVFRLDRLPELANTASSSFDYALCSAVLMHLPKQEVSSAVRNIVRVVKPNGKLICSVRPSRQQGEREADGRLFTELALDELAELFAQHGCQVIASEQSAAEGSDRIWRTLVLQKHD